MITEQVISNCINEASRIAGTGFAVFDPQGNEVASAGTIKAPSKDTVCSFADGPDDDIEIDGLKFLKTGDDATSFILVSGSGEGGFISAYLTAAQIRNLIGVCADKVDRNSFFQELLLDNMLPVDIHNRAGRLHIAESCKRCVFVIEPVAEKDDGLIEMVRELFYTEAGDHVTAVDENHVIVIRAIADDDGDDVLDETANMLVDMAVSEAMSDVRVAYGSVTDDIRGVSRSYREARMALEVIRIFYPERRCAKYSNLGVGRLVYQLPVNLCRLFVKEVFGENIPQEIDEETLNTVNRFFENNLNVSETSRQLFIHRNTLIYRIEKLQKATGLDVRVFDDALTLKIALMVVNYLKNVNDADRP